MESGDFKTALSELNAVRGINPVLFAANNYDYLFGRLSERTGEVAGASASYQSVVARHSLLSQYAMWRLAQIARLTGDLLLERERLRQLLFTAPKSLLLDAAMMRLGQSFFESQDYKAAVAAIRPLTESKNFSAGREALGLTAQAFLRDGNPQEAREAFSRLVRRMPDASRPDDFALAGVRGLDTLDTNATDRAQNKAAQLAESEHLLRASIYQFNRDFEAARLHYLAVVERYPQSATLANALYQIGRGFYSQSRYNESLEYFQRVLDHYPESMSARDALSFTAGTYNRLKRTDDALAAYKRFIQRFPDAPSPERAYLNIIDALHEAGRHKEALQWVQQTRTRFQGQIGDALALFAQMRIHFAQSSWQQVVADAGELRKLSDLGGTRVPGGTSHSEVTFLRGYALEQLGRSDEAISEYLSIPDGRDEYYGKRATQRLLTLGAESKTRSLVQARTRELSSEAEMSISAGQMNQGRRAAQNAFRMTNDQAAKAELLKLIARTYDALAAYKLPAFNLLPLRRKEVETISSEGNNRELTHQALADELIFLGLYDEAAPEFAASRSGPAAMPSDGLTQKSTGAAVKEAETAVSLPSDIDYTSAVYFLRGGVTNRAVRFAEQVWRPVPGDYELELAPREMIELLYPVPFRESLLKHAPPRALDARFIMSIARQESRFQADAKSVAAARGMMQFIPATANETAAQLGRPDFNQAELYNPDTAILFGSQYLAALFRQFPAMPEAVAASYNGGPENVARWIARSRSNEADRYVPELGFSQTKDYVFKVMSSFWVYQQLYDQELQRK